MQPAQPQQLPFSPVPVNTAVANATTPEGARVLLVCSTPQGQSGYFLSAEHARKLAADLTQASLTAATGLEIIGDAGLSAP